MKLLMKMQHGQNVLPRWRSLKLSLTLGIVGLLTACGGTGEDPFLQQSLPDSTEQAKTVALPTWQQISVNNGYLVFTSQDLFDEAAKELTSLNPTQEEEWHAHFQGFTSLASAHEQVNDAIDQYMDNAENDAAARSIVQMDDYVNTLIAQNSNAVQVADFEDGKMIEMKIKNRALSMLLNQDGLVQIAGHLYQYSSDTIRSISTDTQPSRVWSLTAPNIGFGPIDSDPICDMDGHCADNNNGDGGHHGGTPDRVTVWDAWSVSEGETMVFEVEVPPTSGFPTTYDFAFGDGAGSNKANRDDIDLISFSEGVTVNNQGRILVPINISKFTVSIKIREDRREEGREMVTLRVDNSTGRAYISASEACNRCQNFENKGVGTVGHKPAHRIIVYEKFEQIESGADIATTYTIQLRSLKKRDWSPYWTNNVASLTAGGAMRGNKIPASFYSQSFWGHTNFYVIYDHHIDDYNDAPHVDHAKINASRSGGDEGVWAYIEH